MSASPFEQQITFLYTRDLAATAAFYENVLGLPLVRDQGTCRIYRVSQDGYLGFCEHLDTATQSQSVILTLITSAVDDWYNKLLAQGVTFTKPPADNPQYQIYHCFLRDPDGYLIEIQRFYDPLD